MSYRRFLLSITFSLFFSLSYAQQAATLSGSVKDTEGIITGASVRLKDTKTGTLTDTEGRYTLAGVKPGNYTLIVSYLGYLSVSKQISLKDGQTLNIDFPLKKDPQQLRDVGITGKTQSRKIKESGFAVNAIELKQYANTTNDLNQVLNRSAGIKVREQGGLGSDFEFSINGLSGSHIKFFIDGVPMESYGSGMTLNNIPVNLAERIEVYKGVVPAYLGGDALGGAVNIITKHDKGKSLDLSYSAGSFNTHRAALTGSFTDKKTGITTNVSSYYNYSDNDYYMYNNPKANVILEVPNADRTGYLTQDKFRRFHDGYKAFMGQVEAGVANKKWADVFVAGLTYTSNNKQRQTGATQERVIGAITSEEKNVVPSIRYRKENLFIEGLSASVFANFSANKNIITDTVNRTYYWDGSYDQLSGPGSELSGEKKSISHLTGHNALAQVNIGYLISQNHMLNLNHNYNRSYREGYNEIDPYNHSFDRSNSLNKNITGLSYQNNLFNNRLINNVFGKVFGLSGETVSPDGVSSNQSKHYFGYGIASSFKITENTGIKASYEYAYRLPGLVELYGNRQEVRGNPNLKPESSNNYNLGLFYNKTFGKNQFTAEASGFYRDANNYIISMPGVGSGRNGSYTQFDNSDGIIIRGFETEVKYDYNRLLNVMVNLTYQSAVDRRQFIKGTIRENINYMSRTPNEPWLFGNADFSIGKDNLVGKGTRLQFNWFSQFINDYSLTWSKLGNPETNTYIPRQFIHNATATYSLHSGKYNISLESRNLTNTIAYDQFKLQKPGRSFFIKLRYAISQMN